MKIRILLALAGLSAGFITPAFTQTTAKDLVGSWTLVSVTLERDGKKTELYGANPQGLQIRDADGQTFNITGDELDTVSTATPSTGTGTAHLVWRRAGA